ncbi:MAG: RNA 2',3'-cyclic phosphodiesterase [Candidatus Aenigmatarchaeota archaeon]
MRSFLGIGISENLKGKCTKIQEEIKKTGANVKLVERNNLHWTVKFLGEISNEETDILKEIMKKTVKNIKPIKVTANGLGTFPNLNYMKTIWVGVSQNEDKFIEILEKVNKKLEKNGFKKDKHEIKPHITLARVKTGKNKEELKKILHKMKHVNVGEMKINKIHLYESVLKPSGPTYNKIKSFHLGE